MRGRDRRRGRAAGARGAWRRRTHEVLLPRGGHPAGRVRAAGRARDRRLPARHAGARVGVVTYNPYGISFKVLEPANTPDYIFQAIVPNDVVKLSFGAGILAQSYG